MELRKCNCVVAAAISFAVLRMVAPPSTPQFLPESGAISGGTIIPPRVQIVEGAVKPNTTLVATLVDLEVPREIAHDIARLIQPVFDVRKFHTGNTFKLEKDTDGSLRAFAYKINDEKVLEVQREAEGYAAKVSKVDLESRDTVITATITKKENNLYAALGEHDKSAITLAESVASIFAWDVDFNSELQVLDKIRIVVPGLYHEGQFVKWGPIQAAELVNSGKTYNAFRFEGEYYDAKGNAVKRSLLVSPLPFLRLTSGFSYRRLHPITGRTGAHLALDYGAPTGTPVHAVAKGVVTYAGWGEGYGNLVRIKHAGGLSTGYAHLSRIGSGIRVGRTVDQGDLLGSVGQTGLATGPHLHYMMEKNGRVIDPRSMKSEPPIPLDPSLRPQFEAYIVPLAAQFKN
jgi:murein DD-endopeptidase MepM/ murein hydrolase activator NlpD